MDSLERFREDLWIRWRQQFGRLPEPAEAAETGEGIAYANVPLFDLKKYTPRRFPAGGRMLRRPPEVGTSHYAYKLDRKRRPTHMTLRHIYNKIDWRGVYLYGVDEVEYVEFCVQSEVVSEYSRLTLKNGLPASFQHIDINSGGHFGARSGPELIDFISSDLRRYFICVEEYEVQDGKIASGRSLAEGLGRPPSRSALEYSYSNAGKLERVDRVHEGGWRQTEYAARSNRSLKELSSKLSERIAIHCVEALKTTAQGGPWIAVELSYRSVDRYLPLIIGATESDSIPDLCLAVAIEPSRWIALKDDDFEPEMAEFVERIMTVERYDLGSKMLRNAALLVTRLIGGTPLAAEGFVAFAIEWEFEGENLMTILKQCGADATCLRVLKSRGWLKAF